MIDYSSTYSSKGYLDSLRESLHNNIQFGDQEKVSRDINLLPNEKYFFNQRNQSAAYVALKLKRLNIYELLISKGAHLGPSEDLNMLVEHYSSEERIRIREIHQKFSKNSKEGFIEILVSRSKLSHDTRDEDRDRFFQLIRNAYEEISEFLLIKPILQLVSQSQIIVIIFDFNRPTISTIDPTKDRFVTATSYYLRGEIYVGAQLLLTHDGSEVLATLAHEFCHFAMNMVYSNDCKPYFKSDSIKRSQFHEISSYCEKNKSVDLAIAEVFECPDDIQHAELIVTVPFLLAFYGKHPDKFFICMETFPELFEFFENTTLIDLKAKYNLMINREKLLKIRSFRESESMINNIKFHLDVSKLKFQMNSDSAYHVFSNCPLLTIKFLHMTSNSDDSNSLYMFNTVEGMTDNSVIKTVKEVADSCPTMKIVVFYEALEIDEEFIKFVKQITENKLGEAIILVNHSCLNLPIFPLNSMKIQESYCWVQLTDASKVQLERRKINFQGFDVELGNLMSRSKLEEVKQIPLNDLVSNKKIKIGKKIVFEKVRFYIERKLSCQSKSPGETFDDIIENHKNGQNVIIYDAPGMGKTTAVEVIAMKLKAKYPTFWIQFIDLKSFSDVFRMNKKKPLETRSDLIKFIQEKMCKIEKFDAEVFEQLFLENRVKFIFDAFDEICPSFQECVLNLIKSIKEFSKSQIWITTRPHLLKVLKEVLCIEKAYNLNPLNREDQKIFMEKFFNPTVEPHILKIKKIVSFLETESLEGSFSNPLLLRMIANIMEEHDEPEEKLSPSLNLYSIYNEFFSLFVARSFTKGSDAALAISRLMEKNSPKAILQNFAVETVFPKLFPKQNLAENEFKHNEDASDKTLVRLGITFADESGQIQFTHRTFADYFVADFIASNLFLDNKTEKNVEFAKTVFGEVLKSSSNHWIVIFIENMISSTNLQDIKQMLYFNTLGDISEHIDFNELFKHQSFNLIRLLTSSAKYPILQAVKLDPVNALIDAAFSLSRNDLKILNFGTFFENFDCRKRKILPCTKNLDGESVFTAIRKREKQNEIPSYHTIKMYIMDQISGKKRRKHLWEIP